MTTAAPRSETRPAAAFPRRGGLFFRRGRWQFSLRSVLSVMLCVAVLSGLWRMAPQLAVFVAGTALAGVLGWRLRQAIRGGHGRRWAAAGFLLSWLFFYLVSVGPALAVTQRRPAWDPVFDTVYWPVTSLCRRHPPSYRAANWYLAYWRFPID